MEREANSVALYNKQGIASIYSNLDPHETYWVLLKQIHSVYFKQINKKILRLYNKNIKYWIHEIDMI